MTYTTPTLTKTKLQRFADKEFLGAPLTSPMRIRVPKRLSVFIETVALTENVSVSSVIRYFCEQGAASLGYESQRGD